jgi:succinoglycan biosynthesis transport protein ExoP
MDTIDRSESNLPSPFPVTPPPLPVLPMVVPGSLATTPVSQVNPRTLLRGLTRHWWQILLIWLVLAAPAMYLILQYVSPTYEAFSLLQIQPVSHELYGQAGSEAINFTSVMPYLQTQVNLITTDRVLTTALASPEMKNLSFITKSDDSRADLRKSLDVKIVKDAYLIRVALELPNGSEAAAIINAVLESYLAYNGEFKRGENSKLRASLFAQREKIQKEIKSKQNELKALLRKGNVNLPKAELNPNLAKNEGDVGAEPMFGIVTAGQREKLADEMMKTELEYFKVESDLAAWESATRPDQKDPGRDSKQDEEQRDRRIREEFVRDPDIIALGEQIAVAAEQRDHAKSMARQPNDPARRAAELRYKKLMADYEDQWESKRKDIGERLKMGTMGSQSVEPVGELRLKLQSLTVQKHKQASRFAQLKVDEKVANDDSFEATLVKHQLDILSGSDDQLRTNLEELEFKASQEDYRVVQVDDAKVPKVPTNNKRMRYLIAAPVALLFMVLGLFFLLEVKAERVADPDALSTRMRSEVYALPPLPTARAIRKLSAPEADDQIEQFIQRLDHLRFAVCGNPSEIGTGRCVLITSAIGGEGKTTLAAQLAARCGNAGMSTLLIDADLRRAALCPLLDVPEGIGLSDVLKEEATAAEVVIPVQGGTFYFLPAGTPIQDTNRVFQGRQLGILINQLRQLYDLIIIDSPPVLPVPDALILGRWADGAVLAARYDISRFPQVERARRQLDNAGIAIMGTVINGMRNADSYYGRYSYSRKRSSQPGSSETI